MSLLLDDTFESIGYDFPWSDGEQLGGASTLDEDFLTAGIGSPPSWGLKCLKASLVAPDTQAFLQHSFGTDYATTYSRFEFIPATLALGNNTSFNLALALDVSSVQPVWIAQVFKDAGGALFIRMVIYHAGAAPGVYTLSGLELSKRYRIEVEWDSAADTWAWLVDGCVQDSGALTGAAVDWGFGFFQLGISGAGGQGSTVYFDNIQIRTDRYPGPAPIDHPTSYIADVHNEHFEVVGLDETWSSGQVLTAGNAMDPDFDVGSIPGATGSWGIRALAVAIGAAPADDAAHYHHVLSTPKSHIYFHTEFNVGIDGWSAGDAGNTFAILMHDHPAEGGGAITQNIRAYVGKDLSGQLVLRMIIGPDATQFQYLDLGDLTVGTRHIFEAEWDGTKSYWAAWLDGVLVASGHIRSVWGNTTRDLFVGTSGSGDGRGFVYFVDNYMVSTLGYPIGTGAAGSSDDNESRSRYRYRYGAQYSS